MMKRRDALSSMPPLMGRPRHSTTGSFRSVSPPSGRRATRKRGSASAQLSVEAVYGIRGIPAFLSCGGH